MPAPQAGPSVPAEQAPPRAAATRPAAQPKRQPRARPKARPAAEAADASLAYQTPEQVSIYITPAAKERARAMSRAEGIEYAQLAMDAIDHFLQQDMLGFLVRARLEVSRPNGSRFPPRRNLRSKSRPGTRRVLWPVQFRPAELAVLNDLVADTAAEHLSTLVSVAVEAYLLDDGDTDGPEETPADDLTFSSRG
ncbi:hypothetical protein [Nonomuraea sp. NPDC050783]|uniref:hypothetical protein n=1 Tax=Nonomuraea sp. NPDC050783 TaxID=3154634 RepID=UPI003465B9F1